MAEVGRAQARERMNTGLLGPAFDDRPVACVSTRRAFLVLSLNETLSQQSESLLHRDWYVKQWLCILNNHGDVEGI